MIQFHSAAITFQLVVLVKTYSMIFSSAVWSFAYSNEDVD